MEMNGKLSFGKKLSLMLITFVIAAGLWLPSMHLLFKPRMDAYLSDTGISSKAQALAARHLALPGGAEGD